MDIACCPSGHEWCMTGKVAVCSNDLIGGANKDGIVNGCGNGRTKYRFIVYLIIIYHRLIPFGEFCGERMLSFLQMNDGRSRWWQPQVLHIDNRFPIDLEMMAARHGLSYIQQQGIITFLRYGDGCLKKIPFTHLSPTPFGRSDIHHFFASLLLDLL